MMRRIFPPPVLFSARSSSGTLSPLLFLFSSLQRRRERNSTPFLSPLLAPRDDKAKGSVLFSSTQSHLFWRCSPNRMVPRFFPSSSFPSMTALRLVVMPPMFLLYPHFGKLLKAVGFGPLSFPPLVFLRFFLRGWGPRFWTNSFFSFFGFFACVKNDLAHLALWTGLMTFYSLVVWRC